VQQSITELQSIALARSREKVTEQSEQSKAELSAEQSRAKQSKVELTTEQVEH
jgi:hypothetical protein